MNKINASHDQIGYSGVAKVIGVTSQSFVKVLSSISMSSNNYNLRYKVVVRAQPNATSYIVSNEKIKEAYVEQALILLRKKYPDVSDIELAKAILAY